MDRRTQLLQDISEALKNTESDIQYYLDIKGNCIIKTTKDLSSQVIRNKEAILIEPMLKDIVELMEDFALEQETEEIQEHLLQTLKNRDKSLAINNFTKALYDYPRSKKKWQILEAKWLKERALELLDDYSSSLN